MASSFSSSSSSRSSPTPPLNFGAMTTSSEALKGGSPFDMLNVYVMDHLLSFLPVKDIKNCRLVNRTWNQACLKVIPKIAHVVRIPSEVEETMELINLISSSPHFPWTKFELNAGQVEVGTDANKTLLAKLFGLVAPFATGIWIDNLEERLFTDVLTYPALKHLRLNYGFLRQKRLKADFALGIVENAPNLITLDLRGLRITDHALDLLGTSNGRKITHLVMRSVIQNDHLIKLSELGLKLKYLSIHFRSTRSLNADIGPVSIKTLLGTQSAYLKQLVLSDTDEDPQTDRQFCGFSFLRVEFPRMDKLTDLTISAFHAEYPDICYSTLFPTLRKLEFGDFDKITDYYRGVIWSFFKEDTQPNETVEELKFNKVDFYRYEYSELICNAAKQFPSLKKIQIPNKKELLDCVGLSMVNLKELWLLLSDSSDYEDVNVNLAGLSWEDEERIMKLSESQLKAWMENWELPNCFRKITKLGLIAEKLENGRRDALQLTEMGCRFGLLKMEGLKTLELVGDCSQISTELLNELSSKFTVQIRDDIS